MNARHDVPVFADDAARSPRQRRTLPRVIRRRPLAVLGCVLASLLIAAGYLLFTRPTATATARVCVQPAASRLLGDSPGLPGGVPLYNYLRTQCAVVKSNPVLHKAVASLRGQPMRSFQGVRDPVEFLGRTLRIEIGNGDMVISASLESQYPAEAIQIVNAVVDAYIAFQAEQRKATAAELLAALDLEKKKWDRQLEEKTKALAAFRAANRTPTLDSERVKSAIHQLSRLEEQLTEARMDSMAAAASLDAAKSPSTAPTSIADLPDYQQNRADLIAIDRELGSLRASRDEQLSRLRALGDKYSDRHPTVQLAQTMIEQLSERILTNEKRLAEASVTAAQTRVAECKQRESQLQQAISEQEKALAALQGKAAEYARLEADLARATRLYDTLDTRFKEVDVARDVGAISASVLEWGNVPDRAAWPRQLRSIAMALAIGLALGIALAALRDATDRRFRSSDEIVDQLGLPVIGVVPRASAKYRTPGSIEADSSAAAAYGVARAAIEHCGRGGELATLLVTSPAQAEGRTAAAVNLAAVMARTQGRVLLIDANFRHSSLHEVFDVQNEPGAVPLGLSTVLSGSEPVDGLISATRIHGLEVLPAGPAPAHPESLFGGRRMSELLRELSRRYDRIVIDGPQIGDLPDARLLSALCDATVMVVRANRTSRAQAALAVDALAAVGARVAGVVVYGAPRQNAEESANGWCCLNQIAQRPVAIANLHQRAGDGEAPNGQSATGQWRGAAA